MITSPGSSTSATAAIVLSVIVPAGTMIQTVRGFSRAAAKSCNEWVPVAPSAARASTASGLTS